MSHSEDGAKLQHHSSLKDKLQSVGDAIFGKDQDKANDPERERKAYEGLPQQMSVAQGNQDLSSIDRRPPLGEAGGQGLPDRSAAGNIGRVHPNVEMDSTAGSTYLRPGEDDRREEEALRLGGTAGDDAAF